MSETSETADVPAWFLGKTVQQRVMPLTLPVSLQIGPVWRQPDEGGWYAAIVTEPLPEEGWQCDHVHATEEDAWICAAAQLIRLVHGQ